MRTMYEPECKHVLSLGASIFMNWVSEHYENQSMVKIYVYRILKGFGANYPEVMGCHEESTHLKECNYSYFLWERETLKMASIDMIVVFKN